MRAINTRAPKSQLNKCLIFQIEKDGVEVQIFKGSRPQYVGASKVNPLLRLFNDDKLSQQEFAAGCNYQSKWEESNKDGYSKPTLIYQGLPDSARSNKPSENTPTDKHLSASAFIFYVKRQISLHERETQFINDTFKVVDLKLLPIIDEVFEKGKAIRNAEKSLGINHAFIEDRVKKICQILLTL